MGIDHLGLGVPDVEAAKAYYDEFMPLVGFVREWDTGYRPTDWQGAQIFLYPTLEDDLVNSAGHHVQGSGHTSGSNSPTGAGLRGTATWTSDVGGLAPSTYTAHFRVFSAPNYPTDQATANTKDWGTATITFTVDSTLPADAPEGFTAPANITQANVTAVPFSGFAPVGSQVAVAIYDGNADSGDAFGPHPEGTGRNDSLGTAVTPDCSASDSITSENDVKLCPVTVHVDASNSPDSGTPETVQGVGTPYSEVLSWYAYTFTAAGQKPGSACPEANPPCTDPTINKDTTGPDAPSGQTAEWHKDTNMVTVTGGGDSDTSLEPITYVVKIFDPENNVVTRSGIHPGMANAFPAQTIDVSSLNDGPLTVNVYAADALGNLSAPFSAQTPAPTTSDPTPTLAKESNRTAPSLNTTNDTLTASGSTYNFTCGSS
jgi:catechol 2,3-dioxygenase-like lactoylglutathione lyase family enzyme